jgi:hypothetical protein
MPKFKENKNPIMKKEGFQMKDPSAFRKGGRSNAGSAGSGDSWGARNFRKGMDKRQMQPGGLTGLIKRPFSQQNYNNRRWGHQLGSEMTQWQNEVAAYNQGGVANRTAAATASATGVANPNLGGVPGQVTGLLKKGKVIKRKKK